MIGAVPRYTIHCHPPIIMHNYLPYPISYRTQVGYYLINFYVYTSRPEPGQDPGRRKKINFFFTLFCGASKGFMKVLKAFIKSFEAPQRSVKMK